MTWSQSPCVARRPESDHPACPRRAGRASSSSWKTGESTTKGSSPWWTSEQVTCHIIDRHTTTSSCRLTTCMPPALPLEELQRLGEGLDLRRGLALVGLQRLLLAVDPDDRDLLLQARLDVVVVARRDVDPALLRADAPRALLEVRRVGLVRAHLLGGDDEVEVRRQVPARLPEQLVVDVGDEAQLVLLGALLELRVGLLERHPALDGVRQEAGARRLEGPAEVLGDPHGDPPQDLRVELVGAALDLALVLVEAWQDLLRVLEHEAVAGGLALERLPDARLPVDERAVDVEGDEVDLGREGHGARHSAMAAPNDLLSSGLARVRRRSWTSSSTKASSSSPATGSPCPKGATRPPSRRRSARPTTSVTRASSRPRSGSAAGARPAASRSPGTGRRRAPTRRRSSGWTSAASPSTSCGSRRRRRSRPSSTPRCCWTARPRSRWSCCRRRAAWTSRRSRRRTPTRSRRCTSTRCWASRTSTAAASPSGPASTPTSCAPSARSCASSTTSSSPRRRRSSRSTRSSSRRSGRCARWTRR